MDTAVSTISLSKGQKIDLTKANPGLTNLAIGLGWDAESINGQDFDLDAFALLLNTGDKFTADSNLVFFNNLTDANGSVTHSGDNLTGAGAGDDEVITVNLMKVDPAIETIAFFVNIYQAKERGQSFGQVKNTFIRVSDANTNTEIARFDMSEDASSDTGFLLGKVYRYNGEWKFTSAGVGMSGDIIEIKNQFV